MLGRAPRPSLRRRAAASGPTSASPPRPSRTLRQTWSWSYPAGPIRHVQHTEDDRGDHSHARQHAPASPSTPRPARPGRPGADAARRQGARATEVVDDRSASWRRSAAMADALAAGSTAAGVARVAAALPAPRLERRRRAGRGRPLGAGRGARGAGARSRWCCSATRWARVRRSTSPTTRPVRGVVALAPWFPARRAGHGPGRPAGWSPPTGSRDRITSPAGDPRLRRAAPGVAGADAAYVDMGRVGHYMLRRAARLERDRPRAARWRCSRPTEPTRAGSRACETKPFRSIVRNETVSFRPQELPMVPEHRHRPSPRRG